MYHEHARLIVSYKPDASAWSFITLGVRYDYGLVIGITVQYIMTMTMIDSLTQI